MQRWLSVALLFLLLCCSAHADVVLTDAQAKELNDTLTRLEEISTEQQTIINDLQSQSTKLEEQLNESEQVVTEQQTSIKRLKRSFIKHEIFSILLTAIISFFVGGILL